MYTLGIIVLSAAVSPIIIFVGAVILLFSGFPLLYRQKRIGLNGKPFVMYKFRTMIPGADRKQSLLLGKNEANGPVFKIRHDPRYTRVGIFLAHTGLDELPQLFNVIRGEMALIGPRPLPIEEAAKLSAWQKKREKIKPGIISPWILEGYHKQTFDTWMKSDIAYAKKKSFFYDLGLTGRTIVFLIILFVREMVRA